jgi:Na+-driven multidrug efflux pump
MNLASWVAIGVGLGAALAASMGPGGFAVGIALGTGMWIAQQLGARRHRDRSER